MKKNIFVILVFTTFGLSAQTLVFQDYFLLQKNEAVRINKIIQDKTGFIWFGTNKGLFKFDGKNYRRFGIADSLPDENVTALAVDSLGRIWAGMQNGKISIVQKNTVTSFKPAEGMPSQPISDILFDKQGVLWFATQSDGTYYYYNNRLYRLDDIDGLPDLFCYDLEEDKNGNIWVGTDAGMAVCTRTKNSVEIKIINYSNGLPDNIVKKIIQADDKTYIATEDAGLFQYDAPNKFTPLYKGTWSYGSISDFLLADDWLWVASSHNLLTIDLNNNKVKKQSDNGTGALLHDAEGNIWLGSPKGVQRTLGKQIQWIESDENVIALTIDRSNNIWYSDGKTLFKKKSDEEKSTSPLAGTLFATKSVISLYTDEGGFVWAGLYGEGVLRIDPNNGSLKLFSKELRNGSVLNISGKGKNIWLATLGGAVQINTNENFSIKNFSAQNGLSTDYIYQVFVDSKDRVWFATDRSGVDMLDANGFHHFTENLDNNVIFGLAEDAQHRIWANTQGAGLFVFDGKQFHPFADQQRLHSSTINVFSIDSKNRMIAAHEQGIDFFDTDKKSFHFLDEQYEMRHGVANLNAVAKGKGGEIYIGTNKGILIYNVLKATQELPQPWINSIKVNDRTIDLSQNDRLKYDENNIKIDFTGFWYQNTEALNFSYQMENYDNDRIITRDRSVSYSKLLPGEYTFTLRASDTNVFTGYTETKINFVIRPPFWRTNLFYILITVAVALSAYFFVFLRQRQLIADKKKLEAKVRERTHEIEMKTHEIQAQAEEIKGINENLEALVHERTRELEHKNKALEEYAFINAHQLRAPVASILGLINLMQKLELKEDERVYLEHLKESAKKLDTVVTSITEAIERGDFGNTI
ncbi:MAG: hypothetical protein JST48_12525 [Bacteroidetes bacterium]|nr:hypothetical protein [Bacteroidota bacterium]